MEQKFTCYEASYGYLLPVVVQLVQDLPLHTKHESEKQHFCNQFLWKCKRVSQYSWQEWPRKSEVWYKIGFLFSFWNRSNQQRNLSYMILFFDKGHINTFSDRVVESERKKNRALYSCHRIFCIYIMIVKIVNGHGRFLPMILYLFCSQQVWF